MRTVEDDGKLSGAIVLLMSHAHVSCLMLSGILLILIIVLSFMCGRDCGLFCTAKCGIVLTFTCGRDCSLFCSAKRQITGCTLNPAYTNRRGVNVDKGFVDAPIRIGHRRQAKRIRPIRIHRAGVEATGERNGDGAHAATAVGAGAHAASAMGAGADAATAV